MTKAIIPQHRISAKNYAKNHLNRKVDGTFKKSKRGKYNASGRHIDEHWFASKAEGARYEQLKELLALGKISDLELQPSYPCFVNGVKVCTYRADFRYRIKPRQMGSRIIIEDVKGMITKEYGIKRKLVHALHPIQIIELPVAKRGGVERYRYLTADEIGIPPKLPASKD